MPKMVALHLNKPSKGASNPYINLTVREDSLSVYTNYSARGGEKLEEALRTALLFVVQHNKIVAAAERRASK